MNQCEHRFDMEHDRKTDKVALAAVYFRSCLDTVVYERKPLSTEQLRRVYSETLAMHIESPPQRAVSAHELVGQLLRAHFSMRWFEHPFASFDDLMAHAWKHQPFAGQPYQNIVRPTNIEFMAFALYSYMQIRSRQQYYPPLDLSPLFKPSAS